MRKFIVASNWSWGVEAVLKARELLQKGSSALDAVEQGLRVVEDDPNVDSVGTGGIPNADGVLELDASIMDGTNLRGAGITGLQMTKNAISVARKVMELTPHVLIAGQGATQFARECGFPEYDPLTPKARETWEKLRSTMLSSESDECAKKTFLDMGAGVGYDSTNLRDVEQLAKCLRALRGTRVGTCGVVAVDQDRRIAAGSSTSGWAMRFPGRVADSSIIGAGTYANRTAAACSTGLGETAITHCVTKSVCDLVDEGLSPTKACERALAKMLAREKVEHYMGFICVDANCNVGAACNQPVFQFEYMSSEDSKPVIVRPEPFRP